MRARSCRRSSSNVIPRLVSSRTRRTTSVPGPTRRAPTGSHRSLIHQVDRPARSKAQVLANTRKPGGIRDRGLIRSATSESHSMSTRVRVGRRTSATSRSVCSLHLARPTAANPPNGVGRVAALIRALERCPGRRALGRRRQAQRPSRRGNLHCEPDVGNRTTTAWHPPRSRRRVSRRPPRQQRAAHDQPTQRRNSGTEVMTTRTFGPSRRRERRSSRRTSRSASATPGAAVEQTWMVDEYVAGLDAALRGASSGRTQPPDRRERRTRPGAAESSRSAAIVAATAADRRARDRTSVWTAPLLRRTQRDGPDRRAASSRHSILSRATPASHRPRATPASRSTRLPARVAARGQPPRNRRGQVRPATPAPAVFRSGFRRAIRRWR